MLYRISVAERGLTGIASIARVVGNLRRPPKTCHSSSESWENGDSEYVIRYAWKIRPFSKFQYLYNIRNYFSDRI